MKGYECATRTDFAALKSIINWIINPNNTEEYTLFCVLTEKQGVIWRKPQLTFHYTLRLICIEIANTWIKIGGKKWKFKLCASQAITCKIIVFIITEMKFSWFSPSEYIQLSFYANLYQASSMKKKKHVD